VSGALLLRLRGEIDMSTGPQLDHYLAAAAAAVTSPAPLVVDLSGVQHLGSVGVALLTSYHRRCQEAGTPLRIVVGAGPAASALAMIPAGLDLHAGVAGALASVSMAYPAHLREMISYCDWAATPLAGVRRPSCRPTFLPDRAI
jgi:anti-sigma B factor antagonist